MAEAEIAAACALRDADAVYVATARARHAALVTLDGEMLERAASLVHVVTPRALVDALPGAAGSGSGTSS